jgi:hypothetical protein
MDRLLQSYLMQLEIGEEQTHKNLTVYPVLSKQLSALNYLTLDEALSQNLIEIAEIDQSGSVPELRLANKSEKMILILDGEELVGAKQNRIVNTTMLIPPREVVIIPVSCVEQGRWVYKSDQFYSEKRLASPALRAMKAEHVRETVHASGEYRSDQGAIWQQIEEKATRRGARSNSMAMAEIYNLDKPAIESYLEHFNVVENQVGALFLINGKVIGMDCVGKTDVFGKLFKKLVESYALDAIDWFDPKPETKSSRADAESFLKIVAGAKTENHKSVGLGIDLRLDSPGCVGFAMVYGEILHLSVFAKTSNAARVETRSRMQRSSARRTRSKRS